MRAIFFNYIALRLTRGKRSGPAQCAIIASALFGSVNGSAPANVSATGVLTIPMMKRTGFRGEFAGAVEATASCVGQIMPPIMGVGAFIMSEITGIAYTNIMLAALIPAFLFIFSLVVSVALEAAKYDLEPVEDEEDLGMTGGAYGPGAYPAVRFRVADRDAFFRLFTDFLRAGQYLCRSGQRQPVRRDPHASGRPGQLFCRRRP